MELVIRFQILDEAVYVSLHANTFRKDVNPHFSLSAMKTRQNLVLEKENSETSSHKN